MLSIIVPVRNETNIIHEVFDYFSSNLKNINYEVLIINDFSNDDTLEKSKSFGDILILGLNSDDSVRRIKGESRPINSQTERAYILASLKVVDYLVIFNETTPFDLISLIQPDVLVKGGDYEGEKVVGEEIANDRTHTELQLNALRS